ncbi:hypothetical protein CA13_63340 [Planctomycetes bacterium CA13]|uniref:Uncharacterized protein n=1 Tax=Novipirellula herctigrandis TaxID=2527986 RepID=A0A5C5ZE98_9BACT|nr:hypothetical protein CA13_63340 [Planctomycetes bacterium CA13]
MDQPHLYILVGPLNFLATLAGKHRGNQMGQESK